MITHTLNLELAKKIDSIGVPIVVRTMDNETQVISANLFMRGQDYAPTCESARLDIMHEDGSWARIDATTSGHTVTATLPSKALTNGVSMAYFAFIKGPQIETTESFVLRVVASAQETPESDRYFDASINRLYEKWKNFESGAEHAEELRKAAETKRESDFTEAQTRHETAYADAEQKRTSAFNQAEEERTHAEKDRVTAEQARADAEQKRVSAEAARVAEETSRTEAEQKRAAAETARESAESTRASQETARTNAEQTRTSQENARVAAEEARANAETARTHAEDTRTSAEDARKSEEQKRADAEAARTQAESARKDAEGLRAQAESTREEQESLRQAREQTRKEQESTRAAQEQARTQAAQAQADAESKRDLAEAARAQAEALRVAEESKRATAETGRATEEESRKTRFAQMMDAAQNVKFKIVEADDNGTPLGEGVAGIIYLVRGKTESTTNEYTEWIWYEGRWELFGTSGATVEPITPQDIDTVAQDGTISGTRVLSATALNYLWTKLEAKYQTQAQVGAAVSASTEPLAAKLQALDTTKADKQALEDLKASVNTDVKQQLNAINDTLATKATADSVSALEQKAATKDALAQLDANKADKSALETLKQDVGDGVKKKLEDVNATLATKADKETTQAALATKADKKALDALDIDVRTKALTINAALEGKADKQTTDTFADQATKQLKALREWAESTLQSKMQEKYNEGFSKGKQEGGEISRLVAGDLSSDQIVSTFRKLKNNNDYMSNYIQMLPDSAKETLVARLNSDEIANMVNSARPYSLSLFVQGLGPDASATFIRALNKDGVSRLITNLHNYRVFMVIKGKYTDHSAISQMADGGGYNESLGNDCKYEYIKDANGRNSVAIIPFYDQLDDRQWTPPLQELQYGIETVYLESGWSVHASGDSGRLTHGKDVIDWAHTEPNYNSSSTYYPCFRCKDLKRPGCWILMIF